MDKIITAKIFSKLYSPAVDSYKNQNGRLLIIAGSEKYHGSLIYAVKAASRAVGLIYLLSTKENQQLVKKLKIKTAEFISVKSVKEAKCDAILIGPGLGTSPSSYRLVKQVLKAGQRAVLDADALNLLDIKLRKKLSPDNILTPNRHEFKKLFRMEPTKENLRRAAKSSNCHIALKGEEDMVADPEGNIAKHRINNGGLAKGGSGDVLSGLMAAFFSKNPAGLSAEAALLAVDLAGKDLFKDRKHYYDSEDICEQLPKTMAKLLK